MKIKLKGMELRNKDIPENKRGRSFHIADLKGTITMIDGGMIVTISNAKLSRMLKNAFDRQNEKNTLQRNSKE